MKLAVTISLTGLLQVTGVLVIIYILYFLYDLFYVKPKAFQKFWKDQGVNGKTYQFPLGQLPDIQKASETEQIVEYAQGMAKEYGLLQTQIVGCLCQIIVYDPEVCKNLFTSKAQFYHKASNSQKEIMRPLLHNGLLLSEDAYWKQQRTLVSPGFHFWYLQEMVPIICDCIQGWVNKANGLMGDSGEVELEMSHELATQTLDSVATAAFGQGFRSDPARADRFIHALKNVLDNMQARTLNLLGFIPFIKTLPFPSLKAIQQGCEEIDSIVRDIVADRKAGKSHVIAGGAHAGSEILAAQGQSGRRDLLDLLLDAQANMPEGQVLTDRGVEEESINFIAAGAETTSNLCIWMLHRIITEPAPAPGQKSVLEKVKEEIDEVCQGEAPSIEQLKELKYLEAVAYESLRLHPPAPTIPKYATETHEMNLSGGRTITVPAGTTMLLNANVIHRLEEYWPEPEKFKPERFLSAGATDDSVEDSNSAKSPEPSPSSAKLSADEKARKAAQPFAFLGFSAGPRKCIGKNLAMIEIKVIFVYLFQNFDVSLIPGQKIVANTITRLPKHGIRMKLTPRKDAIHAQAASSSQDGVPRQREKTAGVTVMKPLGMI